MAEKFGTRLKHAWDVFLNREPTAAYQDLGVSYYTRPDRPKLTGGNDRTIITSVINRIAVDVAQITIAHVKVDEEGRYLETVKSGLNECLNVEANLDQTGRAFKQDLVMSLLDEGCIAVLPVETNVNPRKTAGIDILSMRVGKVTEWYPQHVKVEAYDERTGQKQEVVVPKRNVAIIENPLYAIMNERNSVMQRLTRKLALLDFVDEQASSGKWNMIIQLPYAVKSELQKARAEDRIKLVETQLKGSQYGVAYVDATEKITQLNRPLENTLAERVDNLTSMLWSQLGITQEIMDGTADEAALNNYYNRTIEPIISAIVDEMKRKFLTKTARTQGHSIEYYRDLFKLVTLTDVTNMIDVVSRNEIMTPNEVRQRLGLKTSTDPSSDQLHNRNMPVSDQTGRDEPAVVDDKPKEEEVQNEQI